MKKLIFRCALPLTLIIFPIFSKWWFGVVIDGKDIFLYGFPLIYKCEGFHTSLSTQYFLMETIVNLLVYFIICFIITLTIDRFWKISIPKRIAKIFWIGFGIFLLGFSYISYQLDDRYFLTRDFEVRMLDNGFTILENHSKERKIY